MPFADLFNHHNTEPALQFTYGYNDDLNVIEVFADQDYAAGDQVFISYGVLTNPDLLLNYGCVLTDNLFESVGLRLEIDDATPHAALKRALLRKHGLLRARGRRARGRAGAAAPGAARTATLGTLNTLKTRARSTSADPPRTPPRTLSPRTSTSSVIPRTSSWPPCASRPTSPRRRRRPTPRVRRGRARRRRRRAAGPRARGAPELDQRV